jgi:predicted transcriptional regulator of viral defense system
MQASTDWDRLYQIAESQSGMFALSQAETCGYSSQHLQKHLRSGRILRVHRGIYRLAHFPASELEQLVVIWLWSNRVGVFSHETSLFLHDLSDALPNRVHMTVPTAWRSRRMRVPAGVVLHYLDAAKSARTWIDSIPASTARQAIAECIAASAPPEITEQAILQSKQRGLIAAEDAKQLSKQLRDARGKSR